VQQSQRGEKKNNQSLMLLFILSNKVIVSPKKKGLIRSRDQTGEKKKKE
jgi:hypothetical protein